MSSSNCINIQVVGFVKNLIFVHCFLISLLCYSQTHTKKYNSNLNRYEFYDKGELVGYQIYNSHLEQWEYYEVEKQNNRYTPPTDINLDYKVASLKRQKYDANVESVQAHIDHLSNLLRQRYSSDKIKKKALNLFTESIHRLNNSNQKIDYSKRNNAVRVKNYFTESYNNIVNQLDNYQATDSRQENNLKKYNLKESFTPKEELKVFPKENIKKEGVPDRQLPKKIFGYYAVDKIEEYSINILTGEKKLNNIIEGESKLVITESTIFFQRNGEKFKQSDWDYLGYDRDSNSYKFEDRYNQYIFLDKDLKTISWVEKSAQHKSTKKVVTYFGLKKVEIKNGF